MRVTQLDLIIPKYMEDSSNLKPRAVLVSGKWGIGKTYALINLINKGNETIDKEGFDFTYIYFSLFGFESVNSIVLQLIKKIDPEYFVQYRDLLSFSSPDEQNDFNGTIIVFDDLERKSKSLTFDALYGLFSSLLQYGFRVVCTCNSDMIPKDEQKYYRIFRDKIFDRVFNVTADDSVFSKVVPDVSVDAKTSFLKDANDNWRIIIKAASFYKEIKTKFNSEKINNYFDVFGVSETDFFRCLVIATSCVFNSFEDMEDTKTQAVDIDEQDKQDFGDNIAFNLWYYFGTKKVNNNLERPTKMLVYSILNNDYNNLVVDIQNKQ